MTEGIYGNCPFSMMYLLLRNKVKKTLIVRSRAWVWPWHYIGVTEKGHCFHFQAIFPHEQNKLAPWWFYAKVAGVSDRRGSPVLKRDKLMELNKFQSQLLFFIIFITLIFPFALAWFIYVFYWVGWWSLEAIKKRR